MTNAEKLAQLNQFRLEEGKAPFADWRNARHQPMLNAYHAERDREQQVLEDCLQDDGMAGASHVELENERPAEEQAAVVDAINSHDFANKEVAEAFKGKKQPSYKHLMAKSGKKSLVDKPVGFAHQFLTQHPELSRKEAVAALVEYGVNYATARTQYQRWFKGRQG